MANVKRGLVAYKSEKLLVEASANGGSSNWRELISNGYVETEESPEEELLEAFNMRSIIEIDDRPPQNVGIAMDTPQLSDPTYDWLNTLADGAGSLFIRAKMPVRASLFTITGAANTFKVTSSDGGLVLAGEPSTDQMIENQKVVPGLYFKQGSKFYVLKEKTDTTLILEGLAEGALATYGAGNYRPTHAFPAADLAAAATWEAFYPGWMRVEFQCEILSFGALDIQIGGRPQTALSLKALSRFGQRLVYTVA